MDNQCGEFNFEGEPFKGCIVTCTYDGCNHGNSRLGLVKMTRRRHNIFMLVLLFLVNHLSHQLLTYSALTIPITVSIVGR
jgi:hypothetical protein